jgi:Tfp pilus assembly protein PilX
MQIKNNRGVILLMTLLILSSILVVTLGAADLVLAGVKMNRQTGYSSVAFFSSEAGLERALWEARKNNYVLPNNNVNPPSSVFSGGLAIGSLYSVSYSTSTPNVTFKSIGSLSGVKRSTEGTYATQ